MTELLEKVPEKTLQTRVNTTDAFLAKWESNKAIAKALLSATGFLPAHFKTVEQVMAVMLQGRELGIPTMFALQNLFPVGGRIGMTTQLMNALARNSKEIELFNLDDNGSVATCKVKRKGYDEITTTFSMDDAKQANLLSKDNWKNYPKNCRMARAMSANFRITFPDYLGGMGYTPEELGAVVAYTEDESEIVHETVVDVFDAESGYDRLMDSLTILDKKHAPQEDFDSWMNINKDDLPKLSEKKRSMIQKVWDSAYKRFIKIEVKDATTGAITGTPAVSETKSS